MASHLAVQVQDTWQGQYPVLILNADPLRTRWKSSRWAGQTPEFWMRKVIPTGLQAACCAGTQLVTNISELAAYGSAVPVTAPHQCSCACANTRLYSIPSVIIFGCWPNLHMPQPKARNLWGWPGTAGSLMTQAHRCQPKGRENSTAPSWAGSSLLQEGSAVPPACESDLSPCGCTGHL